MRASVLSFVGFVVIFFQMLILSTIVSHSAYNNALGQSLDDSVTLAVYMLQEGFDEKTSESLAANGIALNENPVKIEDMSAFKSQFISYLTGSLDSRFTDISVDIYGADEENGILSVEVTGKFQYTDGKSGTVSCYKTTILNSNLKS